MRAHIPCSRLADRFGAIVAVFLLAIPFTPVNAADPKPTSTSLDKVPADVETYGSMLRMGETIEMIGKSQAWNLLWKEEAVQELWKKAREAYEEDKEGWGDIKKFLKEPANQELPALLADAGSQEIFLYLGNGWADVLGFFLEVANSARFNKFVVDVDGVNNPNAQIGKLLRQLAQTPQRIKIPDLVVGFKVSDPAKVTAQLKRLEPLIADELKETPLKSASSWTKIEGDEFLVLKLDASLVPWDLLPLGMYEEKPGDLAPLIARLKKLTTTISVGVREGYLLLVIGESTQAVTKFGGKGEKLSSRPEFEPLKKFADKPLVSLGYVSADLARLAATRPEDISGLAEMLKTSLEEGGLNQKQREEVQKDIDGLAKDLAKVIVKPGAQTSFSFRTPSGWKSYGYDYSPADSSPERPLSILNHLGGDPLMALVGRSQTTVKDYQLVVKWIKIFAAHGEKILLAKHPDSEEPLKIFHKDFVPLLQRFSESTEKLWLPALVDGQQALVLDSKWSSKRWQAMMPESQIPLPMLELGLVLGVSDSEKFEEALGEYRLIANEFWKKIREVEGGNFLPEFAIPRPEVERKGGKIFAHYPIPEAAGLDEKFLPTGGLTKSFAALSLSRKHTDRLLTDNPLHAATTLLSDPNRPLDAVFYVNWAELLDVAPPWLKYVHEMHDGDENAEKMEQTARKIIKVLQVFRSYTSITYREKGATVTHSEGIFKDLRASDRR